MSVVTAGWKRDGIVTATLLVLVLGAMFLGLVGPTGVGPNGPSAPAPPSGVGHLELGTPDSKAPTAADALAVADRSRKDTALPADPPVPAKSDRIDSETKSKSPKPRTVESEAAPKPTKSRPSDVAAKAALADDPRPTAVEAAPKPVGKMDPAEVRQALERHRGWAHRGEICVTLSHARISPETFDRLVEFYLLDTTTFRVQVFPDGRSREVTDRSITRGKLVGPMEPPWSPRLIHVAEEWFNLGHSATATFVLSAEGELLVSRALAEALGEREPVRGSTYELGLELDQANNRVFIKVLGVRPPGAGTS